MLESLREETKGKLQMLLSLRKNGLTSLFKEVRVFEVIHSSLHHRNIPRGKTSGPCRPSTAVSRPSGPKTTKKSPKSLPRPSGPESQKTPEKDENKGIFRGFFDFFGYFRGLFCRPPKRRFSRLFWDFGPRGPGDSCTWSLGSQDEFAPDLNLWRHNSCAILICNSYAMTNGNAPTAVM